MTVRLERTGRLRHVLVYLDGTYIGAVGPDNRNPGTWYAEQRGGKRLEPGWATKRRQDAVDVLVEDYRRRQKDGDGL